MTSSERQLLATLKGLVEACKDGENGYRIGARYAKAGGLTELLHGYAQQRAEYAAELQSELERRGGHSQSLGTIAGALKQGWTRIQSAFTGGNEKALIADCERGEAAAKYRYEEALKQHLPAGVRALFERQCAGVVEAQGRIQALASAAFRP